MNGTTPPLKAWLTALTLLAMASGASAETAASYVKAQGFAAVQTEKLEGQRYYTVARFPRQSASAFLPDSNLAAPVRAMLLLDSYESPLPHARYLIDYQLSSEAANPDETRSFVEITRINLGPAVRADLASSVPPEHLAPAKEFGIGPHVRWRFAMAPRRGMNAGLEAASRMELAAQQAAALDCLGQACTRLESAQGPKGNWKPQAPTKLPLSFARSTPMGTAPASAVEHLLTLMGEDAQQALPFSASAPRLSFVVSANAGGQETQITGLARNRVVFDDSVGAQWLRLRQIADAPPEAQLLNQPRKK